MAAMRGEQGGGSAVSAVAGLRECARLEMEFAAEVERLKVVYEGPEIRVSTPLGMTLREVGG